MTKVVIYARVSSKEQEKEGFSIPAQLRLLREYAEKHDFEVVHEFTDSETAKKIGRTQFQNMLLAIKKDKIQGLLVEKTDRLTRNFKDYVAIDEIIQTQGLEVHLVKEGEILGPNAKSHTKLIHGIKVVLAKNYIDNLSDEVKKGMIEKAEQGHYPAKAPYGYHNNKESRLIDIDEKQISMVKRAFELYSTGNYSLSQVRDQLFDDGFVFRPSQPKLNKSSLEYILKNVFYTGDFIFRDKFYKGKHTPTISLSMFEKVQQVFEIANRPKKVKHQFVFAGLMTCGHCGCSVTGDIKKGRYIYYHCSNGKGKCEDKYIREEIIAEQFEVALKRLQLNEESLQWVIPELKEGHKDEIHFHSERIHDLRTQYDRLSKRIDLIYDDKLDGKIPEELWFRKNEEYKLEMRRIEESMKQHTKGNFDYVESGIRILELAQNAHKLYLQRSTLEQRRLLNFVLSNCILKAGKVDYTYKRPFDYIAHLANSEKWWAILDSNQ
ncbi:MAG: recombinase family protein [Cyanobacteria bacterium]|nr:recombinase family protein [Cyanobacteriota bacterium]